MPLRSFFTWSTPNMMVIVTPDIKAWGHQLSIPCVLKEHPLSHRPLLSLLLPLGWWRTWLYLVSVALYISAPTDQTFPLWEQPLPTGPFHALLCAPRVAVSTQGTGAILNCGQICFLDPLTLLSFAYLGKKSWNGPNSDCYPTDSPHIPQHPMPLWGSGLPRPLPLGPSSLLSSLDLSFLPLQPSPPQLLRSFPPRPSWTHLLFVGKSNTQVRWSFGWSHVSILSSWSPTSICKANCLRKLPESLGGLRKQTKLTSFVIIKLMQLTLWEFNVYVI